MALTNGGKMVHVKVSTTQEGHEGWSLDIEVERGTTVAALKELLAGPPHYLPVPAGNKVLERRGGVLMGLTDKKIVTPEVALLGFVPKAPVSAKAAEPPPAAQAEAVAPAPVKGVAPAGKVMVKVTTTVEKFNTWQRIVEVPKSTTIADLKRILSGPPHNLQLQQGQRLLTKDKNQAFLSGTKESDKVSSDLVLLNFSPEPSQPKESQGQTGAQAQAAAVKSVRKTEAERVAQREYARRVNENFQARQAEFDQLPNWMKRVCSYGKVVSFARFMLYVFGAKTRRFDPNQPPDLIWVLNSTDEVEVELARLGLFNVLNDLDLDGGPPTELVLMGDEVDELEIDSSAEGSVITPHVRTANYRDALKERRPDMAVILNPRMGNVQKDGTARNAGHMHLPKELLLALRGVPVVVSHRRAIPQDMVKGLPGGGRVGGPILFPNTRNPFSCYPANPSIEFDDNGWITGAQDTDALQTLLRIDLLPEFQEGARGVHDDSETRTPALFWGIIDLKYDEKVSVMERVKMLETGDGRTSRFSGAGAVILKRYKEKYRLEDGPGTGKSAVISANKKLTHDLMVQRGFEHLVPKQVCFNRVYTQDLAEKITQGLGVGEDDVVVLKLCNRTRAAGVLPVPVLDLDNMLKKVLKMPDDMDGWLSRELAKGDEATLQIPYACLEEHIRHWWSCECPFFVAERLATSTPTSSNWSGQELEYDGTMRVAFALRRKYRDKERPPPGQYGGSQHMPEPADIDIEWLGGYWKLPKEPAESCKLRESIISAAKTGTTYVDTNHLLEVFAAMGDSVQQLFGGSEPVASTLASQYAEDPVLASYLVGRIGIAMRDLSSCRRTCDLARKVLDKADDNPSKQCAQSFINRGFGVVDGMTPPGRWSEAQVHFQKSIECLPFNASSLYLQGMACLELGDTKLAIEYMRKAMILDLDFRAPYVNLGVAYLRVKQFDAAIAVSEAVLKRHPDSPQSNYHIAIGCYQKSVKMESSLVGPPTPEQKDAYDQLRARALRELLEARDSDEAVRAQHRSRIEAPWTEDDDYMLEALKPGMSFLGRKRDPKNRAHRQIQIQADTGWRFLGWRT